MGNKRLGFMMSHFISEISATRESFMSAQLRASRTRARASRADQ